MFSCFFLSFLTNVMIAILFFMVDDLDRADGIFEPPNARHGHEVELDALVRQCIRIALLKPILILSYYKPFPRRPLQFVSASATIIHSACNSHYKLNIMIGIPLDTIYVYDCS